MSSDFSVALSDINFLINKLKEMVNNYGIQQERNNTKEVVLDQKNMLGLQPAEAKIGDKVRIYSVYPTNVKNNKIIYSEIFHDAFIAENLGNGVLRVLAIDPGARAKEFFAHRAQCMKLEEVNDENKN